MSDDELRDALLRFVDAARVALILDPRGWFSKRQLETMSPAQIAVGLDCAIRFEVER